MLRVDGPFLKHLLAQHGDALGTSVAATAMAGASTGLPGNAEARTLLESVARKMADGPGWRSLTVSLPDDEPTRVAKALDKKITFV